MPSVINSIRGLDFFAVPVQLTYKGQKSFNTLLGGCCSLLIILVFLTYAIIDLHELIKNPILTGVNYEYYTPRAENTKKYDILTNDFTMAYLVDHTHFSETKMTSDEINTYLRVIFYKNLEPVPASLCRDKYAEQISQGSSFLDQ